jgi:hypothetical protein
MDGQVCLDDVSALADAFQAESRVAFPGRVESDAPVSYA